MNRSPLVLYLLLPFLVQAQTKLGSVAYTVPTGWSTLAAEDSFVAMAPDSLEQGEFLQLYLMLPAPAQDPLASTLDATWSEVLSALSLEPVLDEGLRYRALPAIQTFDGRILLIGQGKGSDADGTFQLRIYILQVNDLYLRVVGVAKELPASIAYPPTSALYNPRFAYQIPEFVLQLSTGAILQPPAGPAKSLLGLWRGLSMFGGALKNSYAYFYPDGRVFFGSRLPLNGFDGMPPEADAVLTPGYWGQYAYDGAQGEIQFPYQGNVVFPFTQASNKLTIVTTGTPHEFAPQAPVDGLFLEGTYALKLLTGETLTLSLSRAGQFVDRGVLKHEDHWIYPFRISDQPGEGSYAVSNFTLIFQYTDGRMLRLPFSGLGITAGDPSPATLFIGPEDDSLTLVSTPAPRLTIAADASNHSRLMIRWPSAAAGYVLEAADALTSLAWSAAPEQPSVDGTDNVVTIAPAGGLRFFRLVKR